MKNLNSQRKAARLRKICIVLLMIACLIPVLSVPAFASADVAGAVTDFEWHIPAIIFCSLVVSLTAPLWIWNIIGWGKKA